MEDIIEILLMREMFKKNDKNKRYIIKILIKLDLSPISNASIKKIKKRVKKIFFFIMKEGKRNK